MELKAALANEKRAARRAAIAFSSACARGNVQSFYEAVDMLALSGGWRTAMARVGKIDNISPSIQEAFLRVWIEKNNLPVLVEARTVLARALRRLFPQPDFSKVRLPLIVFRGTGMIEHRDRQWGFSWTTKQEVARDFAERNSGFRGGVVLRAELDARHVLLLRENEGDGYYDEGEVVVDPFLIRGVRLIARIAGKPSERFPSIRIVDGE